MSDRNAAIKWVATDGGLGTGGSADGGAMGDAGVGAKAEGGEAKVDRIRSFSASANSPYPIGSIVLIFISPSEDYLKSIHLISACLLLLSLDLSF